MSPNPAVGPFALGDSSHDASRDPLPRLDPRSPVRDGYPEDIHPNGAGVPDGPPRVGVAGSEWGVGLRKSWSSSGRVVDREWDSWVPDLCRPL